MCPASDLHVPSKVTPTRTAFDRFADRAMRFVSSAAFFAALAAATTALLAVGLLDGFTAAWVAAVTVVGTFLVLFALVILQTATRQADLAVQHKLNAIAPALLARMGETDAARAARELEHAIGLETREAAAGVNH